MALKCNIDSRGAMLRLVGGIVSVLLGVAALIAVFAADAFAEHREAMVIFGGLLIGFGAFGIFEGVNKWCAFKALLARMQHKAS